MVQKGTLRYWALGFYAAIVGLLIGLDKIPITQETAIALLAPITLIMAADTYKHKDSGNNSA